MQNVTLEIRASLDSNNVESAKAHCASFTATFARLFDPHVALATPRRWVRSSKLVGDKRFASSHSRRKFAARRNSRKDTFFGREDHPLTSVPVCRKQFAEVTRSCVVKEIVSLSRQDNDET